MNHIVIDLEMNKIEKRYRGRQKLSSELIEIGAVKMDAGFAVIEQYQTYVMPEYDPMDEVIIELTGITDDMLVGAPSFSEVLDDFADWVGKEETQFYSWSMSDLRQFCVESAFKKYSGDIITRMKNHWTDFQEEFSRMLGIERKIKLKQAVNGADYRFEGAQHTALADAVNTAEILRLSKDQEQFEQVMEPILDLFRPQKEQSTLFDMCPEFFATFLKQEDSGADNDRVADETKRVGKLSENEKT